MFDGPAYEGYVQLCRELRLEREFELGDIVHYFGEGAGAVDVIAWDDNRDPNRTASGVFWLPRLDQWYAMIRETWARGGGPSIDLYGYEEIGFGCETDIKSVTERGEGKTPEEAAGRLWMAVTGRTVTSGRGHP